MRYSLRHVEAEAMGLSRHNSYVINLDKRQDRLVKVLEVFDAHGLPVTRWPAVDGRTLPPVNAGSTAAASLRHPADPFTAGCVGLSLSVLRLLEHAGALEQDVYIFEDDARVAASAVDVQVADFVAAVEAHDPGWQLIFLGGDHIEAPTPVGEHVWRCRYSYGTHAWVVSKGFVQRLAALLRAHMYTLPLDVMISEKVYPDGRCYCPQQPLFAQQYDTASDIRMDPWAVPSHARAAAGP